MSDILGGISLIAGVLALVVAILQLRENQRMYRTHQEEPFELHPLLPEVSHML